MKGWVEKYVPGLSQGGGSTNGDITVNRHNFILDLLGKNYTTPMEEKFRLKIYMENKAKIAKHNQKATKGDLTILDYLERIVISGS